jgi:hypothetical protein
MRRLHVLRFIHVSTHTNTNNGIIGTFPSTRITRYAYTPGMVGRCCQGVSASPRTSLHGAHWPTVWLAADCWQVRVCEKGHASPLAGPWEKYGLEPLDQPSLMMPGCCKGLGGFAPLPPVQMQRRCAKLRQIWNPTCLR